MTWLLKLIKKFNKPIIKLKEKNMPSDNNMPLKRIELLIKKINQWKDLKKLWNKKDLILL